MSKLPQYIHECVCAYESSFPEDWIEGLCWTNGKVSASYRDGLGKIYTFLDKCFVLIGKSLLSGEYLIIRPDFNEVIKSLKRYWEQDIICPESDTSESERKNLYHLYETLNKNLIALFYAYQTLVLSVDEKMEYGKHKYLFRANTITPENSRPFSQLSTLRDIIIPLCELEHRLDRNKSVLSRVTEYRERLSICMQDESSNDCKNIYFLAITKANFILKKLLEPDEAYDILIDCKRKRVCRANIPYMPIEVEKMFSHFENIHEEKPCGENMVSDIQSRIYKRKNTSCDTALLINHYCSNDASSTQVDNFVSQFDQTYTDIYTNGKLSNFDTHALNTLRNFVLNCKLNYNIKRNIYSVEELRKDMEEIEAAQDETLIRNFYPYYKAAAYIISQVNSKIEHRDCVHDYKEEMKLLESYLKKGKECLDWCETHKFYPLQLPFDECRVNCKGFKLFLPSSLSRPVDYKKLRESLSRQFSEFESLKTSLIYIKDRQEMETLRQYLNDTEKRCLQVGSILIGVVTFLFGTINIFTQNGASGHNLFVSVLGLGTMLVIFGLIMILIIDRSITKAYKVRTIVCSLLLLVYTGITVWYATHPNLFESEEINNESVESKPVNTPPKDSSNVLKHVNSEISQKGEHF